MLLQHEAIVASFKALRVAVCGDYMLDVYATGRATGFSPEDPSTVVVRQDGQSFAVGGAGFAAVQAACLGADVYAFGVVGADDAGRQVHRGLRDAHVDTRGLLVDPSRPTTTKMRMQLDGRATHRWDLEMRAPLWSDAAIEMAERSRAFQWDGLLLSDYGKGVLRGDVGALVAQELRAFSKVTVLDPKARLRGLGPVDAVTPNRREFMALGGSCVSMDAAERFRAELGAGCQVFATRGEWGCSRFGPNGAWSSTPSRDVVARSTVGAGDVFAAALMLSRAAGGTWDQAAVIANAAASVTVELPGTTPVTPEQVLRAIPEVLARCPNVA